MKEIVCKELISFKSIVEAYQIKKNEFRLQAKCNFASTRQSESTLYDLFR